MPTVLLLSLLACEATKGGDADTGGVGMSDDGASDGGSATGDSAGPGDSGEPLVWSNCPPGAVVQGWEDRRAWGDRDPGFVWVVSEAVRSVEVTHSSGTVTTWSHDAGRLQRIHHDYGGGQEGWVQLSWSEVGNTEVELGEESGPTQRFVYALGKDGRPSTVESWDAEADVFEQSGTFTWTGSCLTELAWDSGAWEGTDCGKEGHVVASYFQHSTGSGVREEGLEYTYTWADEVGPVASAWEEWGCTYTWEGERLVAEACDASEESGRRLVFYNYDEDGNIATVDMQEKARDGSWQGELERYQSLRLTCD